MYNIYIVSYIAYDTNNEVYLSQAFNWEYQAKLTDVLFSIDNINGIT